MSFPVPIAYNITDDHNTEVVYGNGDTLDLIRTMIDIPADLVLKYEEFTPDHDITSTDPLQFNNIKAPSHLLIFAVDDITHNSVNDIAYFAWRAIVSKLDGNFSYLSQQRVLASSGSVTSKTFVSYNPENQSISLPAIEGVILPGGKTYAILQIKMGSVKVS